MCFFSPLNLRRHSAFAVKVGFYDGNCRREFLNNTNSKNLVTHSFWHLEYIITSYDKYFIHVEQSQ